MKATKTNSQGDSRQLMESTLPLAFWALSPDQLLQQLHTRREGLTEEEAAARLRHYGANALHRTRSESKRTIFLRQFTNPIVLILIGAALLSGVLGDATDTLIILAIVLLSGLLGFWVADWSQSNFARNPTSFAKRGRHVADWSQSNFARNVEIQLMLTPHTQMVCHIRVKNSFVIRKIIWSITTSSLFWAMSRA
jgi:hypothetical protein